MTEAIACSALLRAAPANHRALWSGGSLAHQKLEVALALYATGGQKVLHQLEDTDDVSALLGGLCRAAGTQPASG